jgi:hypothetical protein
MSDLRTAAEMALERLESHDYWMDEEAIQALRQALAQEKNNESLGLATRDYIQVARAIEAKLKEKNT